MPAFKGHSKRSGYTENVYWDISIKDSEKLKRGPQIQYLWPLEIPWPGDHDSNLG